MRRSEIRRTRIKPPKLTPKRQEKREEWSRTRARQLEEEPECQLRGHPTTQTFCGGRLEVHHVRLRSQGGKNDGSTPLMTLCSMHHDWSHMNKIKAVEVGSRE